MSSDLFEAIDRARREKANTRKQGLTADQKAELRTVFDLFDADKGGSIDQTELFTVMKALGFTVSRAEVLQMIAEIDADGSGTVDFEEFLGIVDGMATQSNPLEECKKAFQLFTGAPDAPAITLKHLMRVALESGLQMTEKEVQAMLELADMDGSSDVDFDEFVSVMRKAGQL